MIVIFWRFNQYTTFGQCLHQELAGKDISITTFAPGGIATEMTDRAGLSEHFGDSLQMMPADRCARAAVAALVTRRYLRVPGLFNRFQLFLPRLFPRRLVGSVVASAYRKALVADDE